MNSVPSLCLRRLQANKTRRRERRASTSMAMSRSVEEEYLCAIRTSSYANLCDQVERHWSTAARPPDYSSLLLEPKQEAVAAVVGRVPRLLLEFFHTTLLACNSCGALIDAIRRARANQLELGLGGGGGGVAEQLRGFYRLGNPFAGEQLERAREAYDPLARQLMAEHRRAARRQRLRSVAAFFGGGGGACEGARRRRRREEAQVGAAARGAFAVDRDLDTMRSMARRVGDEIEHTREVIELAVEEEEEEEEEGGVMVREVVRELRQREGGLWEQLAELEEHVFLCCLNINRARKMVLQEIDI